MKVAIVGLWHLGTVTAACLAAAGHDVVGVDSDAAVIARLGEGTPPVFEPGLAALVKDGAASGRLRFTQEAAAAVGGADVVWLTVDTPVDDDDRADVEAVVSRAVSIFPHLSQDAMLLISSQIPVGTTGELERLFAGVAAGRRVRFAYLPENLRLGKGIETFSRPERVVAGVRSADDRGTITELLQPFTDRIEWMSVESAEMTKHALNAFLATSVAYINEIASLCEQVGADASEVERGLKSDDRIGGKAYLSPGGAFSGGTLARDVVFLSQLGAGRGVPAHVLSAVKTSNDAHRTWPQRRLADLLGEMTGRTVAVWGLTYKPGTDTLRRSSAIELCQWLNRRGAVVRAHDPVVRRLPPDLAGPAHLLADPLAAAEGADALVVATPWPEFREVDPRAVVQRMAGRVVLDAGRFLAATLGRQPGLRYMSVGRGAS